LSEIVEDCAREKCNQFGEYPDENGRLHCRDCYDGPADFTHVPDDERRTELIESYSNHDD